MTARKPVDGWQYAKPWHTLSLGTLLARVRLINAADGYRAQIGAAHDVFYGDNVGDLGFATVDAAKIAAEDAARAEIGRMAAALGIPDRIAGLEAAVVALGGEVERLEREKAIMMGAICETDKRAPDAFDAAMDELDQLAAANWG